MPINTEFFALSKDDQSVERESMFQTDLGQSDQYKNAPPHVQQKMRNLYDQDIDRAEYDSPNNPTQVLARENQENIKYKSFGEILLEKTKRSFKDLGTAFKVTDDMTTGEFDDDFGRLIAESHARQQSAGVPAIQKELMTEFETAQKEFETAETTWGKTKAVLGGVGDFITNPKGSLFMAADSVSSLGSSLAAGYAGAKAGAGLALVAGNAGLQAGALEEAVTVPVGTILGFIGGATGRFAGSLPASAKAKFQEDIIKELTKRNLVPNEKNINDLVKEDSFTKPALKRARTYAATIGAAEAASGVATGKLGNVVSKAKTAPGMILGKTGLLAAETATEGLGEAAAIKSIGDKVELTEILAEMAGGAGMAPISTAVDKAIFAGEAAKEVSTKKFKNIIAGKSDAHKKDIEIQKSKNKVGYKSEIENTPENYSVDDLVQPGNEAYNPVKATKILANRDDEQSYEQMREARDTYVDDTMELYDRAVALDKIGSSNRTKEESKELTQLKKQIDTRFINAENMSTEIAKKDKQRNESISDIQKIDPETSSSEDIVTAVNKSLGSHGRKNAVTNKQIEDTLKSQPNLPGGVKTYLKEVIQSSIVRDEVETHAQSTPAGKSMSQVKGDIHTGTSKFKGIDNFHMEISNALAKGDIKEATAALGRLKNFDAIHTNKASTISQKFADVQAGIKSSPETDAAFKKLQEKKGSNLVIKKYSGNFVKTVQLDAKALTQAVKTAESMIAANDLKTTEKAPTGQKPVSVKAVSPDIEAQADAKATQQVEPKTEKIRVAFKNVVSKGDIESMQGALNNSSINPTETAFLKEAIEKLSNKEEPNAKEKVETQGKAKEETPKKEVPTESKPTENTASDLSKIIKKINQNVGAMTEDQLVSLLNNREWRDYLSLNLDNELTSIIKSEIKLAKEALTKIKSKHIALEDITEDNAKDALLAIFEANRITPPSKETKFTKTEAKKVSISHQEKRTGEILAKKVSAKYSNEEKSLSDQDYVIFDGAADSPNGGRLYGFTSNIKGKETTIYLTTKQFNNLELDQRFDEAIKAYEQKDTKSKTTDEGTRRTTKDSNRSGNVSDNTKTGTTESSSNEERTGSDRAEEGMDGRVDDLNFDKIQVTVTSPDGKTEKQVPYDQAMKDINDEITLYKGLLACVQGS